MIYYIMSLIIYLLNKYFPMDLNFFLGNLLLLLLNFIKI